MYACPLCSPTRRQRYSLASSPARRPQEPTSRDIPELSRRRATWAGRSQSLARAATRGRAARGATREANELERELLGHVRALAPALLEEPGVGPVVAAQLIVACSQHGRLRSEACFARLAGVAPIPASSGQTQRHRLSRGGDRQLNRALHTIVLHRRQHDTTHDYIAKRIAEGKSRRDAAALDRYLVETGRGTVGEAVARL